MGSGERPRRHGDRADKRTRGRDGSLHPSQLRARRGPVPEIQRDRRGPPQLGKLYGDTVQNFSGLKLMVAKGTEHEESGLEGCVRILLVIEA
ncbi:hypothetical protein ES706_01243 [subsurface metagenome]